MKLSVIVPAYNAEAYIERCVRSILDQTMRDLELIVVDDGSIDRTFEILKGIEDKRLTVIRQENQGASVAMNTALERAQGEWIAEVDNDDYLEPDMYERLLDASDGVDIVKTGYKMVSFDGYEEQILDSKELQDMTVDMRNDPIAQRCYIMSLPPSMWSCIYRHDFLKREKIKWNADKVAQLSDTSFAFVTKCTANKVRTISGSPYHYWFDRSGSAGKASTNEAVILESRLMDAWLETHPELMPLYRDIVSLKRFRLFHWHYNRLNREAKGEWLTTAHKEMQQDIGHLNPSLCSLSEWTLLSMMILCEQ